MGVITMDHVMKSGTPRRELLKGAAGLAAGAAAATMLTGSPVATAAEKGPMSMTIDGVGTFEVLAFSWGASQSGSLHTGGGAGAGKASFQDLSATKYVDGTSPELLRHVATGIVASGATLTAAPKSGPVVTYRLVQVLVTSLSTGGSNGEDRATENLSLNFARFEYSVGGSPVFGWDIAANTEA